MSDSNYNVDDILAELKRHKESENGGKNEAKKQNDAASKAEKIDENDKSELASNEKSEAEPEKKAPEKKKTELHINEDKPEKSEKSDDGKEKTELEDGEDKDGEVNLFELAGLKSELSEDKNQQEKKRKKEKKGKKNKNNAENSENGGEKVKFHKTKKGKIIISVICVILALIIGAGIFVFVYVNDMLNLVTEPDDDTKTSAIEDWTGMDELREDFSPISEASKAEISNLSDMCKTWYYTGKPASSSRVLNILLIGEDTRGSEIVDEGFRADSAIIASVNQDTGKIVLTSILRDTYVYYEVEAGNRESGKFSKINEAMSYGGLDCYIRAVENNYKINIDNYVLVNFESFKKIIDTLGGIDIEVTSAEIKEINNHQSRYGNVTIKKNFDGKKGLVHLNGEQALAYCRIRYIDSDGERANRQKKVLTILFEKAQNSSAFKSVEIVTNLLPYVKTGAKKQEIVNLASYALKNGWIKFELERYNVPENYLDENGAEVVLAIGGSYKGSWKWKADLPLAAQITQQRIYGKTSITLNENRPKFANLA